MSPEVILNAGAYVPEWFDWISLKRSRTISFSGLLQLKRQVLAILSHICAPKREFSFPKAVIQSQVLPSMSWNDSPSVPAALTAATCQLEPQLTVRCRNTGQQDFSVPIQRIRIWSASHLLELPYTQHFPGCKVLQKYFFVLLFNFTFKCKCTRQCCTDAYNFDDFNLYFASFKLADFFRFHNFPFLNSLYYGPLELFSSFVNDSLSKI